MAAVPVSELSQAQKDEVVCTYAALILQDTETEVTGDALAKVIKASGCSVEAYWPALYAKMLAGKVFELKIMSRVII